MAMGPKQMTLFVWATKDASFGVKAAWKRKTIERPK